MTQERYTDIRICYQDRAAVITIDRPGKLNAIRINTYKELITAFQEADSNPDCHIIVLEGEGGQFTAGNDLADLVGADGQEVMDGVQGIFDCVSRLQKVLLAVVEGVAVGIGTTLLLHCDIVVASSETRFRLPFANLGVCPEGGSSLLLPRAIGEKKANEVLLTGRFFSADEAMRWGMITAVADPGKAKEVAQGYMDQLLRQPLASLLATKKLLKRSRGDVSMVVADELRVFKTLLESEATRSRISAFLQQR
ncbi:MAG: enoyl-CoA hydratase-related protein [Desulfopila sp.]|jgi:enoyl-CoA hydratase/carnithine racemase|nr:enoyl-CoA hydratase-related protein [Desulfopila sp.]